MTTIVEKRRVYCSLRHVSAFVPKLGDGSHSVKCSFLFHHPSGTDKAFSPEIKNSTS